MTISNQNEDDRPGLRGTRRDNVAAGAVDDDTIARVSEEKAFIQTSSHGVTTHRTCVTHWYWNNENAG
jgi:hypothetical protein